MSSRPANKKRAQPQVAQSAAPSAHPDAPASPKLQWIFALMGLGLVEAGLSVYQWRELLTVAGGGDVACSINEQVNCATVWTGTFATRVHELLGIPVAALGVVWGLTALAVAAVLLVRVRSRRDQVPLATSVRLVGAVGALSCVTFAVASFNSGAVCPTCLVTYVLVLAYAGIAFATLGKPWFPGNALGGALGWAAAPAVLVFLALWFPSLGEKSRPAASPNLANVPAAAPQQPARPLNEREQQVATYIEGLSPAARQGLAAALAAYRVAPVVELPPQAPRRLYGPADAPVKLVEWTDGRCPHCATLVGRIAELKRVLPAGLLSVEARHYPLAAECNSTMQRPDPTGVSCAIAQAQVCLEQAPDYWTLREQLFSYQRQLRTVDNVLTVAANGSVDRATLEACLRSPETQAKLDADIKSALAYNLTGTPLVVLNGRKAPANETLIYVLAMVGGDANSPAFAALPSAGVR